MAATARPTVRSCCWRATRRRPTRTRARSWSGTASGTDSELDRHRRQQQERRNTAINGAALAASAGLHEGQARNGRHALDRLPRERRDLVSATDDTDSWIKATGFPTFASGNFRQHDMWAPNAWWTTSNATADGVVFLGVRDCDNGGLWVSDDYGATWNKKVTDNGASRVHRCGLGSVLGRLHERWPRRPSVSRTRRR